MAMLKNPIFNWIMGGKSIFQWMWGTSRVPEQWKMKEWSYNAVFRRCCDVQLFYFVVLTILMVVSSINFKEHLMAIPQEIFIQTTFEVCTWIIFGYFLGIKRLPANFISCVALKVSLILDNKLFLKMHTFEMKVLRTSQGPWSVTTYNENQNAHQNINVYGATILTLISALTILVITKFTRIDLSMYEKPALIFTSVMSSFAATLSLTSYLISDFPDLTGFHLACSELWLITAFAGLILIVAFLCQRQMKGQLKSKASMRVQTEGIIFVFTLYIMVRFLPVIHTKLSIGNLLVTQSERLTKFLIPSDVWDYFGVAKVYETRKRQA